MQTFEQIQQQIVDLQKQAETMRKQAVSAAVKEVKRLVNLYSLSIADLGLAASASTKKAATALKAKATKAAKPAKAPKAAKKSSGDKRAAVAPKYRDSDSGQTWTGRGKAPTWLAAKLAAGATKEQFKI
jgi:DNA-binding protein H-NS